MKARELNKIGSISISQRRKLNSGEVVASSNSSGLLALPTIPSEWASITEVIQYRNIARDFLNKILALQKINGNIDGIFDFQIPNYWTSTNFDDRSTYDHNGEPFISKRDAQCGSKPGGIKFRAINNWYNCHDGYHPKFARWWNGIKAAEKEANFFKAKFEELEDLTAQKVVQNTSQQDYTKAASTVSNSTNALYIILGLSLVGGAGYLVYRSIKNKKDKK